MKDQLKEMNYLKYEVASVKQQNKRLKDKMNEMENYSRRENLILDGIPEQNGENCGNLCKELRKCLAITQNIEVVRAHRLGGNMDKRKGNRPMIIRFRFYEDKELVLRNRSKLRNSGIFLNDGFSITSIRQKSSLLPVLKEL